MHSHSNNYFLVSIHSLHRRDIFEKKKLSNFNFPTKSSMTNAEKFPSLLNIILCKNFPPICNSNVNPGNHYLYLVIEMKARLSG